jgi:large-conductance mechanosensitive channel
MAKRLDDAVPLRRAAGMVKIKRLRTADCVVGGFRYASAAAIHRLAAARPLRRRRPAASRRLHVELQCRRSARPDAELEKHCRRRRASRPGARRAQPLEHRRSEEWVPLEPRLVAEVRYDHFSEGRFRHGTRFERWRPDKDAAQCTFHQIETEGRQPGPEAAARMIRASADHPFQLTGGRMAVMKEFREFAVKGNVVDMAVGIIIGAAFGTIVRSSSTTSSCRPSGCCSAASPSRTSSRCCGRATPRAVHHAGGRREAGAVTINYGVFINTGRQLPHRRVRRVHARPVHQPAAARGAGRARGAHGPAVPVLCDAIPMQAVRCPHCTS